MNRRQNLIPMQEETKAKRYWGGKSKASLGGEMMFLQEESGKALDMDFEGHEVTMQNILGGGITRDKSPEEGKQK